MSLPTVRRAMSLVLWAVLPSFASTIYISANDDFLYTIDPTTGLSTPVGNMGVAMSDIAFIGGALYGVSFTANSGLYRIDASTGAATFIGATGTFVNALVFGSDGTLYATGGAARCGPAPATPCNSFYRLDTTTGAATLVGNGSYNSSGDLEIAGSLFLSSLFDSSTDQLFTVDTKTGAGTLVGNIGFAYVFGLAYVPETNTLYGFNDIGNNVIRMDRSTGAGTSVSTYSSSFEILGAAVETAPEPGGTGAVIFGLSLIVAHMIQPRGKAGLAGLLGSGKTG